MSAVSLLHCLEHRPGECEGVASLTCAPGESGLGQHRFNEDRERAFDSLARLDDLDADVVLFDPR